MNNMQAPLIGVGIMLLNSTGQLLLGQRIKADEQPSWCFPGGKVDVAEHFEQAAVRELAEETALTVAQHRMHAFCLMNNTAATRCNSTVGLCLHIQDHEVTQIQVTEPHIFASWQWFDWDQLPDSLFPETQAMIKLWRRESLAAHWSVYRLTDLK